MERDRRGQRIVVLGGGGFLGSHVCARLIAEGAAGVPVDHVLAGRTDVVELAGVVSGARLVLAGDTGVGHLATALGRPSVLLRPDLAEPLGPTHQRPARRPVEGLHRDPHGDERSGVLRITVDEVLEAAAAV